MKGLKKYLIVLLVFTLILTFTACKKPNAGTSGVSSDTSYPLTITDDLGNEITFDSAPQRIVSVTPSNTEILFALGLGDKVVGRTEYCNYPEEAQGINTIGTFRSPNVELIIDIEPEVVFANGSVPEDARTLLEGAGIKVVVFDPQNIDDVLDNINKVGQICDVNKTAKDLTTTLESKRQEIKEKVASLESKKVFVDIGSLYSAGPNSFMNSILQELNVENIAADGDTQWPQLSTEEVIDDNPDVYITLYNTVEDIKAIAGFEAVTAVANDNIIHYEWGTVENNIIQRPGPRIIQGLEVLAKGIYPEAFAK